MSGRSRTWLSPVTCDVAGGLIIAALSDSPDKEEATGSSPVSPTVIDEQVRRLVSSRRGRAFSMSGSREPDVRSKPTIVHRTMREFSPQAVISDGGSVALFGRRARSLHTALPWRPTSEKPVGESSGGPYGDAARPWRGPGRAAAPHGPGHPRVRLAGRHRPPSGRLAPRLRPRPNRRGSGGPFVDRDRGLSPNCPTMTISVHGLSPDIFPAWRAPTARRSGTASVLYQHCCPRRS
jgi:hypothetical protein